MRSGPFPLLMAAALAASAQPTMPAPPAAAERVTLTQALERVQARNPSIEVAQAGVARAEALLRQARGTWVPTLNANALYTRLDDDRVAQGRVVASRNQLQANLNLTVPLLAAQKWAASSRASDNVAVAERNQAEVRRQLALSAAHTFLSVLAQRRAWEVAGRAVSSAQVHLRYAQDRLRGGLGNRLDALRAEQEVATSQSQQANAGVGLLRAREALGVLLAAEGPVDAADEGAMPPLPSLTEALAQAKGRADLAALQGRLSAAEHAVRDDWTDYAPLLSAVIQPFYQHPATLLSPESGWQAQLVLSVPLFDGGVRYGLARERRALLREARANLQGGLRQATSEVRGAFEAVQQADVALKAAQAAARLSEQTSQMAELAYRAGATTDLDALDAQRRARDAEAAAAAAEDQARQARLDLLAAAGRLP